MRLNVLAIFALVALAASVLLAIQQSPNFSSQTTGLYILTSNQPGYRYVTVPMPYREQQRTISAPVPPTEFGTAWANPTQSMGANAPTPTPAGGPSDPMGTMSTPGSPGPQLEQTAGSTSPLQAPGAAANGSESSNPAAVTDQP